MSDKSTFKGGRAHKGTVMGQKKLAGDCYRLLISAPALAAAARAGQFVHILPRQPESTSPLLRRAFSVMTVNNGCVEVLYRAVGRGTTLMSLWNEGQGVDLLGPLGRPFAAPEHPMLLIGGGVGTPPLVMLASQTRREQPNLPIQAYFAAKTAAEVLGAEDLKGNGVDIAVATDDGSEGHQGFVTDLVEKHFAQDGSEHSIYACGPLPMLRAVAALCDKYGRRALLSLEENMPCGTGVCNGCSIPVLNGDGDYGQYRRICVEGPSVWSDQIDWAKLRF